MVRLSDPGGGGVLGDVLGVYVQPRSPNLDSVLERLCIQTDTSFLKFSKFQ